MDGRTMKVAASSLNLRSSPSNANSSNITVSLPSGQLVQVLDSSRADGWWRVSANFRNSPIEGFVASRYLTDAVTETAPPASAIVAVNLSASAKLSQPADAHSLDEPGAPRRVSDTPDARCGELAQIIAFLQVETQPPLYSYFIHHLLQHLRLRTIAVSPASISRASGGWIPRSKSSRNIRSSFLTWAGPWTKCAPMISKHGFGQYGPTFGWKHTLDPADLQMTANQGGVGVIVARNKADSHSGHIVVVPPETNDHKANRSGSGQVTVPLQSQAGRANFRYGMGRKGTPWWTTGEYSAFGLWSHA